MILAYDTFRPSTFVDAFRFMGDNAHLMLEKTVEHLQVSGEAIGLAILVGVPLGVVLGHVHRGSFLAIFQFESQGFRWLQPLYVVIPL